SWIARARAEPDDRARSAAGAPGDHAAAHRVQRLVAAVGQDPRRRPGARAPAHGPRRDSLDLSARRKLDARAPRVLVEGARVRQAAPAAIGAPGRPGRRHADPPAAPPDLSPAD